MPWAGANTANAHRVGELLAGCKFVAIRELAENLSQYRHSRVVVRYGDHPLIRELYPEPEWTWHLMDGRNQGNNAVREALIVRN